MPILILARTPTLTRALEPLLASNRREVRSFEGWPDDAGGARVALIEDKLLEAADGEASLAALVERAPSIDVVALGALRPRDRVTTLLHRGVRHFASKSSPTLATEVLAIVRKLSVKKLAWPDPSLGLAPYLAFGAAPTAWMVSSTEERERRLQELDDGVRTATGSPRLGLLAREVADELLLNALVHGPNPTRTEAPRWEDRVSVPSGAVELEWGYDGETLGVMVADSFGTLRAETVAEKLAAPTTTKPGGLGLYSAFERLGRMVVNLLPGRRTEVIGLFDATRGVAASGNDRQGLNLFTYGEP